MAAAEALARSARRRLRPCPRSIAAAGVADENVNVLRACAEALGAIGPAAKAALPVLRQIAAKPDSRTSDGVIERSPSYAAEQAIAQIEGENDPRPSGERLARLFYGFCALAGAAVLGGEVLLSSSGLVPIRGAYAASFAR